MIPIEQKVITNLSQFIHWKRKRPLKFHRIRNSKVKFEITDKNGKILIQCQGTATELLNCKRLFRMKIDGIVIIKPTTAT